MDSLINLTLFLEDKGNIAFKDFIQFKALEKCFIKIEHPDILSEMYKNLQMPESLRQISLDIRTETDFDVEEELGQIESFFSRFQELDLLEDFALKFEKQLFQVRDLLSTLEAVFKGLPKNLKSIQFETPSEKIKKYNLFECYDLADILNLHNSFSKLIKFEIDWPAIKIEDPFRVKSYLGENLKMLRLEEISSQNKQILNMLTLFMKDKMRMEIKARILCLDELLDYVEGLNGLKEQGTVRLQLNAEILSMEEVGIFLQRVSDFHGNIYLTLQVNINQEFHSMLGELKSLENAKRKELFSLNNRS